MRSAIFRLHTLLILIRIACPLLTLSMGGRQGSSVPLGLRCALSVNFHPRSTAIELVQTGLQVLEFFEHFFHSLKIADWWHILEFWKDVVHPVSHGSRAQIFQSAPDVVERLAGRP